jgi:hypothetical protein
MHGDADTIESPYLIYPVFCRSPEFSGASRHVPVSRFVTPLVTPVHPASHDPDSFFVASLLRPLARFADGAEPPM